MKKLLFCILLLLSTALQGQQCYEFDRYVDGNFFDTYTYCSDDLYIDLQDFSTAADLFYITPVNGLGYATGSQNVGNNQWRQFYRNVKVVPTSDIALSHFYFNTHDNWQSFNFTFSLEGTTLYCDNFDLQNFNYRNYFSIDCESAFIAKSAVFNYQGEPPAFNGTIRAEHITIKDGNNTDIEFSECCLLKADTLTLIQSAQNKVKIDGHVIAERLESEASLELRYDDAVVTIGEMPNNVKIFGNENTTVNLCLNRTLGADKFGYFKGTVMFNYGERGWSTVPSEEGDINYNDYSGDYWTWKNSGKVPEEIGAYNGYDECISEYIDILQYIREEEKQEEKNEIKDKIPAYRKYNVLGQRMSRSNGEVILEIKYGTPIKRCHTRQ